VRAVEIVSPGYDRAGWTTMGRSAYLKVVPIVDVRGTGPRLRPDAACRTSRILRHDSMTG
jgi:hypothetical protein